MSVSRRVLLRTVGGALGAAAFLGSCAPSRGAGPATGAASGTARRGGTLRVALTGGGPAESLDPYAGAAPSDIIRSEVLYDSLFTAEDGRLVPALARSAEPAPDGRSFTARLREGVRWHDGSPFTAEDVAYSLRYMVDPARPYQSQIALYVDAARVEVVDDLTLRVPLSRPVGDPALMLSGFPSRIVRAGTTDFTPETALGTGPYRVAAFDAGRETRLVRFDEHWGGPPAADELVLVSLADQQAKANAVLGGQVDYTVDVPFTVARTGSSASDVDVRAAEPEHRVGFGFVLNSTKAPFDDPRVRLAARLAVDRQAMVDTVFLGFGSQGNDLYGAGTEHFDDRPPLSRDVERARRLVTEANAGGARVVVRSAEYESGFNASAELLARYLVDIGLDARAEIVGLGEFFTPDGLAASDAVAFAIGAEPLLVVYGRMAGIPALAFADTEFSATVDAAIGAVDPTARADAWARAQALMAERGNTLVWGRADVLSMARKSVAGVRTRRLPKYPYLGQAGLT